MAMGCLTNGQVQKQPGGYYFQIELNEKKHPKEKRTSYAVGAFNVNSVIYGKTNNFYQLKFGMGQQRVIGGKWQ